MNRYELTNTKPLAYEPDYRMVADEDGDYCLYSDVARLEKQLAELKNLAEVYAMRSLEAECAAIKAEARYAAVMEWARGRCECCRHNLLPKFMSAERRERLVEAQAKMLRNKPVRAKIVYRELP